MTGTTDVVATRKDGSNLFTNTRQQLIEIFCLAYGSGKYVEYRNKIF